MTAIEICPVRDAHDHLKKETAELRRTCERARFSYPDLFLKLHQSPAARAEFEHEHGTAPCMKSLDDFECHMALLLHLYDDDPHFLIEAETTVEGWYEARETLAAAERWVDVATLRVRHCLEKRRAFSERRWHERLLRPSGDAFCESWKSASS